MESAAFASPLLAVDFVESTEDFGFQRGKLWTGFGVFQPGAKQFIDRLLQSIDAVAILAILQMLSDLLDVKFGSFIIDNIMK
jgi:hypothetical protein